MSVLSLSAYSIQRNVKMTWVMVGLESILSREQIILRKTVNICFVTWPPLIGNVSLNEAGPLLHFP